jgi:hypothetical protein
MQWNMADNVFENNIVYAGLRCLMMLNKSQLDKNRPPAIIDHNLYYCASGAQASTWAEASNTVTGFDKYVEATGNDRSSHFSDPHFVDPAKADFHLQSDSPALAAGTIDNVPMGELDLDRTPRVKSGTIDIGCYQRR